MKQEELLRKYYKGETSFIEEEELKQLLSVTSDASVEKDVLAYFEMEKRIPDDLEEKLFAGVIRTDSRKKTKQRRLYSLVSVAASLLLVVGFALNSRSNKITQMESDFFVMEQALYQVSQGIQPEEQEDMLVLWIDDDVEIIIN